MTKRTFDILGASFGLVVFAPVMLIVAIMIRWRLGSPVLFRQQRVGMNGRIFEMVKFRTMLNVLGPDGAPRPDSERLTSFGKILRSSSLDELPELWNVLQGDMSLVGPRPLLVEYLDYYTPTERRRHEVRPGITGLAQIRGRNALSWRKKFRYDVFYVDHASVGFDLKIILMTITAVIGRVGIAAKGEATMHRLDIERSGPLSTS
ncbi:MAG TPA: sugar transferase [Hyphomicrobium sp.]|nr:sugar transferase [Hyphomicrobium sp.]